MISDISLLLDLLTNFDWFVYDDNGWNTGYAEFSINNIDNTRI